MEARRVLEEARSRGSEDRSKTAASVDPLDLRVLAPAARGELVTQCLSAVAAKNAHVGAGGIVHVREIEEAAHRAPGVEVEMKAPPGLDLVGDGRSSRKTPPDTAAQEGATASKQTAGKRIEVLCDGPDGHPRRCAFVARDEGSAGALVSGREGEVRRDTPVPARGRGFRRDSARSSSTLSPGPRGSRRATSRPRRRAPTHPLRRRGAACPRGKVPRSVGAESGRRCTSRAIRPAARVRRRSPEGPSGRLSVADHRLLVVRGGGDCLRRFCGMASFGECASVRDGHGRGDDAAEDLVSRRRSDGRYLRSSRRRAGFPPRHEPAEGRGRCARPLGHRV